jgi:hypothetical protein
MFNDFHTLIQSFLCTLLTCEITTLCNALLSLKSRKNLSPFKRKFSFTKKTMYVNQVQRASLRRELFRNTIIFVPLSSVFNRNLKQNVCVHFAYR